MSTQWKFFLDSESAWEAMLADIESARESVLLEQFILETDLIGSRFLTLLQKKAREGIKVHVLLDSAGSLNFFTSSLWKNYSEPNLSITFFNSLIPWTIGSHTPWYFRDHQKLLVVDSRVAFTGGICLGDEMKTWRDTHVRIEGPVVEKMAWMFHRMYNRALKKNPKSEKFGPKSAGGFNYITSSPLPRRRFLYYRLTDVLRNAMKRISISTPYFIPDRRILRILQLATRRGVEVSILIPEISDNPIVDFSSRSFFSKLLKTGVRLYLYRERMMHAKTIVVDDDWSSVGSLNFDNISLKYNFEGNIVSTNRQFTSDLASHFAEDLKNAKEVLPAEWKRRSFALKVIEWFCGMLSPLL